VVDSESGSHFQNFLLGIRKGADGRWRIGIESTTTKTAPRYAEPVTADRLIADLDEAGIRRAVVLSVGFWLGEGGTRRMIDVEDGATAVRMENDCTAEQIARYPDRLVMARGINPLRDFAVAELVRCSSIPGVIGMKINVGDAGVRFDNPEHVAKLRALFSAAHENGMAMIVHLEPGRFYGSAEVELFLDRIASAAPDVTIQIAHLAGNGPGITSPEALEAAGRRRPAHPQPLLRLRRIRACGDQRGAGGADGHPHAADRPGSHPLRVGCGARHQREPLRRPALEHDPAKAAADGRRATRHRRQRPTVPALSPDAFSSAWHQPRPAACDAIGLETARIDHAHGGGDAGP
jgi:predicted TIM-barrel fold metal-dependent hydrolase